MTALQSAKAAEGDCVGILAMPGHGVPTGNDAATPGRSDQAHFATEPVRLRPVIVQSV